MKADRTTYRVVKTLAPTDRGALGLAAHYGEALVCVRHRTDAKGKVRHTTVELLVESQPMRPRSTTLVSIRTNPQELTLHAVIQQAGGKWDSRTRVWRLPKRVAGILSLRDRIIKDE